jgi:hypothetical protein
MRRQTTSREDVPTGTQTSESGPAVVNRDLEGVTAYVREKWTVSGTPSEAFDPNAPVPPLTMTEVPLDSRIWRRGKGGKGPFERVMIRAGSR